MGVILSLIFFACGLVMLVGGAHFLVNGASSLARRLAVPEIAIGLTVVAFGTSTPELIVNIFSSLGGYNEIVFGNIIGSNIFNILIILGISGTIYPLSVQKNTIWKEIPFSLLAAFLLLLLVNDVFMFGASDNILSRIDGVIFLLFFAIFLIYIFGISKVKSTDIFEVRIYKPFRTVIYILIGFGLLFLGGKLAIDNTLVLARQIGVSEKLIALTIVAGGTSLPELATSTVAAYKKRSDIAVGNIIGSNIFNIFFILGVSSVIRDAPFEPIMNTDLYILFVSTLLLFFTMFTGKIRRLDRWESFLFIVSYIGYLVYLFYRK